MKRQTFSPLKRVLVRRALALVPPLAIAVLLPWVFSEGTFWYRLGERAVWIYFFIVLLVSVNHLLSSTERMIEQRESLHGRPMKGFFQLVQVLATFLTLIVIASIVVGRSPLNLITGLGAFAAVLMLVFKDTILGFVAGIVLTQNDMVRTGDWIVVPSCGADGVVLDISLTVVKVQNWDNTIVTIPPYSLVSDSFVNWRGMSESDGRRIMRELTLSLDYIKPCTPAFLERMKAFDADLARFISAKQRQASEGRTANTDNPDGLPDGTIDTNLGLLRAYLALYLRRHPSIVHTGMTLMVRTLAPTPDGLPLQLYCFSANKRWESYESIQAEIMEHLVSILPAFELYPYQSPSARATILGGMMESHRPVSSMDALPWHTIIAHPSDENDAEPPENGEETASRGGKETKTPRP